MLLVLLVAAVLVFAVRGGPPTVSDDGSPTSDHESKALPVHGESSHQPPPPNLRQATPSPSAASERQQGEQKVPSHESVIVKIESKKPPREDPPDEVGSKPPSEPEPRAKDQPQTPPQRPAVQLADAAFLSSPLPDVARGTAASGRPVTLLEFPRPPVGAKLELLGLDWINSDAGLPAANVRPKLAATYSASELSLTVHDTSGAASQIVATFFLQKNELRFKWKARASLVAIQRLLRAYAVLHISWKGHPGRYYALHDRHTRDARRIRDQQVRLRPSELPSLADPENLYLGPGKLEIADVYSHRFLVVPKAKRLELPTLTRSRKDPPIFVTLVWHNRSLLVKLDSPINTEQDAQRRRRLFEHIDGNFHLHASLYRVVDNRVKVEILRLGSP